MWEIFEDFKLCLGDIVAMERVAWEFCEDIASNGILYVEARLLFL